MNHLLVCLAITATNGRYNGVCLMSVDYLRRFATTVAHAACASALLLIIVCLFGTSITRYDRKADSRSAVLPLLATDEGAVDILDSLGVRDDLRML